MFPVFISSSSASSIILSCSGDSDGGGGLCVCAAALMLNILLYEICLSFKPVLFKAELKLQFRFYHPFSHSLTHFASFLQQNSMCLLYGICSGIHTEALFIYLPIYLEIVFA